jgi:hypothetical protein
MSLSKEDFADIQKLIVEGTMEALNAVVIPRLDGHDSRFDGIEARLDKVGEHLAEHDRCCPPRRSRWPESRRCWSIPPRSPPVATSAL